MLAFNLAFEELYTHAGLSKLDAAFLKELSASDVELFNKLVAARINPLAGKEESEFLIKLAPHVEDFIGALFDIRKEITSLAERHNELAPLYSCKRLFVQRKAAKAVKEEDAKRMSGDALLGLLPVPPVENEFFELVFAKVVM